LAYQDFVAGAILTATQVDTIMRQTVMTFASTAARDSALSGVLGEGMVTYQLDANTLTYYNGSAWVILSEPPQTWNVTNLVQSGSVSCTTTVGWFQRCNGVVTARVAVNVTGSGTTGNNISLSLPFTAPNTRSIGGNFEYVDLSSSTRYSGSVVGGTTSAVAFSPPANVNALLGAGFAAASGDTLDVTIYSTY
jgi:hypothetical protein